MSRDNPATFKLGPGQRRKGQCGESRLVFSEPDPPDGIYLLWDGAPIHIDPEAFSEICNLARRALRDRVSDFRCSPRKQWNKGPLRKTIRHIYDFLMPLSMTGMYPTFCVEMGHLASKALKAVDAAPRRRLALEGMDSSFTIKNMK